MIKIEVLLIIMYVEVNELETMLLATNLILDNLASTVVLGSLPLQPEENHDEDYRREGHEDFLAVRITEYAHKSEYILIFWISAWIHHCNSVFPTKNPNPNSHHY